MALLSRITLWLGGLGFLGFGVACLVAPLDVLAAAGVTLSGPVAAAEVRAFYGGLEIGLGVCLVLAALRSRHLRSGLLLCMAAYGGIGLARATGMAIDGVATPFLWFALATELTLAGLAGLALLRGNRFD
ncbi:MAG: DUF4345 family protein [Pseudomarimonas sp.]